MPPMPPLATRSPYAIFSTQDTVYSPAVYASYVKGHHMPRLTQLAKPLLTAVCIFQPLAMVSAWEDPARAPLPRPTPQVAPENTRTRPSPAEDYSQYLDEAPTPAYTLTLALFGEAEVKDHSSFTQTEITSTLRMAYYENVLKGDIDLGLELTAIIYSGSAGINLPAALIQFAPEIGWTWRYMNSTSLALRTAPGIYGDLTGASGSMLAIPSSLTLYRSFSPQFSAKLGALVRPAWDLPVIPEFGFIWAPAETLRFDIAFPASQITWYALRGFSAHMAAEWDNDTYAINAGDDDPDTMTIEETRVYGGIEMQISNEIRLLAELGIALDREYKMDGANDDSENHDYVADDTPYFRFGIVGPF